MCFYGLAGFSDIGSFYNNLSVCRLAPVRVVPVFCGPIDFRVTCIKHPPCSSMGITQLARGVRTSRSGIPIPHVDWCSNVPSAATQSGGSPPPDSNPSAIPGVWKLCRARGADEKGHPCSCRAEESGRSGLGVARFHLVALVHIHRSSISFISVNTNQPTTHHPPCRPPSTASPPSPATSPPARVNTNTATTSTNSRPPTGSRAPPPSNPTPAPSTTAPPTAKSSRTPTPKPLAARVVSPTTSRRKATDASASSAPTPPPFWRVSLALEAQRRSMWRLIIG